MPTNTLTDTVCRLTKPTEKPQKLFDGHGLHLYISPKGAKTWRMAYRLNKKPQTATFGPYPLLSLAEARLKRDELRRQLLDGEDPRKEDAPTKAAMTLRQASEAYWGGRQDLSPSYLENATRAIENHLAKLLDTPIKDISRGMLMEELRRMDAAGLFEYVRKVRMWVGQVFEWAIENDECETNPAAAIKPDKAFGKKKVVNHAALRLVDVPVLMDRLKLEDDLLSVLACKLMALTWVRTGELRFMLWTEIESGGKMWRIPEGKMKRRHEHLVPLSLQAQQILAVLKARSRGSNYVFPSENRTDRPMSENTVLYLLYRLGYKGEMTGHGWRSVVSTWANERGFNPDAIERQLAHIPDDKVRAAYNRAAYLPTRRKMLQAWADWLDHPDTSGDEC